MLKSAMPVLSRVLVPEVLPAVMPQFPAVPEFLPAAPAAPVLPPGVPADLPAAGREELAAALAGPPPGAQRKASGKTVLPDGDAPLAWDDAGMTRFLGFLRSMSDRRDPRGRRLPLDYLTAVAVAAGAAGDDSPEGAAAWAASAPARLLHRLGAPRDAAGRPRRPDAATFARVLGIPGTRSRSTTPCVPGPPPVPVTCGPACGSTCGRRQGPARRRPRRPGPDALVRALGRRHDRRPAPRPRENQ